MAKGIYIGENNLARKVKKIYIGVNGIARKVKKAYIGVNGVAKLFYSGTKYVPFTSNPVPTKGWKNIGGDPTKASVTSSNGIWRIEATALSDLNYHDNVIYAVDSPNEDSSVYVEIDPLPQYLTLSCPPNIKINPQEIRIRHSYTGSTKFNRSSTLQGYGEYGYTYLATLNNDDTGYINERFTFNEDKYYSKFRINVSYFRRGYFCDIEDFVIEAGIMAID